jgi:hypothetical protein
LVTKRRPRYRSRDDFCTTAHFSGRGEGAASGRAGIYQLEIDPKTGGALKVQIIQSAGHPLLNRAAMNGLMLWRARPGGVRIVKLPICFEFKSGQPIVTYGN